VVGELQSRFKRRWGPHGFLQRFGAEQVQMIDCRDGKSVHWLTLAHFFAGYMQPWTRALCPDTFRKMMLKLKDWPPDQDFRSKMPEYYEDLMQALPFPQYTHREGVLNLAKYFPRQYVPPDLGPKMYNAYGRHASWRGMDPQTNKGGHTNLHCDVSDAVNVMVDVGFDDEQEYDHDEDARKDAHLLRDSELGDLRNQHGAIWDIYRWEDTDAILGLLHAVARERDVEITNNPIHDQLFYLDEALRRRLRDQYGVRGWRFVQRHGDAIFIPAGCPHQVRNLSSCVKVALDFVSPENAHRCVRLTDQFAKLPRGHHLSEDKLQVKTMLLHAMEHISEALLADGTHSLPLPEKTPDVPPAAAEPAGDVAAVAADVAVAEEPAIGGEPPADAADALMHDAAAVDVTDDLLVEESTPLADESAALLPGAVLADEPQGGALGADGAVAQGEKMEM
jgi:lysine-specific demethylase 3